jgi:subfamily B ATP-binding cassette protein MsbA
MKLYLKVLSFIKPFIKHISIVIALTILYVFFNNLSVWVSVDFIQELFSPDKITEVRQKETRVDQVKDVLSTDVEESFYRSVEQTVKGLLIQKNRRDTLLVVCLVIFLSFFAKNITHYLRRILLNFIELKITVALRNRVQQTLLYLPLRYFDSIHTGNLTSIVFTDVGSINQVLQTSFGKLILAPVQIIANLIILFSISWKLTLITLTIIPVSALLLVKIGKSIRRRSRRMLEQNAVVVATFQESISGIRIVKAFTNEMQELSKFIDVNIGYFKKNFRQRRLLSATSPINETVYVILVVALLWYGGNLVFSNQGLLAGDFLRFLIFLFLMIQPIKDLSGINNTIQTGMAAAERVFGIIDTQKEELESYGSVALSEFKNSILLNNVYFRYNDEDGDVIKNVNLEIKKGEMVAFVGPSGAGKTTLINLLPRFYDIKQGEISIDGVDIANLKLKSLRENMSVVTQDTILFNDTVRTNIAYGQKSVTEAQIINAAKTANAWEFIEKMEKGLNTKIGEKGIKLSGGQKQRLSIARAILKNPPILILDEATSALDTESERLVQEAIDNLLQNRTVLVIAHRLSTIKNATKIVVMKNGAVDSVGTHSDLLKNSPLYKGLYENQLLTNN